MFRCRERGCGKVIRTVRDIRGCAQCVARSRAQPDVARPVDSAKHEDDTLVNSVVLAELFTSHPFEPHSSDEEAFRGGGGESAGGGASGDFDSPSGKDE